MIDGSLPLQAAIVAAVKGSVALEPLISGRIYDRVPMNQSGVPTVTFPYVSFGPIMPEGGGGDCDAGTDYSVQIDVWSRKPGRVEAAEIGAALSLLLDADLTVTGHRMIVHEFESFRTQLGQDGLTTQGILRLRYQMVPTA